MASRTNERQWFSRAGVPSTAAALGPLLVGQNESMPLTSACHVIGPDAVNHDRRDVRVESLLEPTHRRLGLRPEDAVDGHRVALSQEVMQGSDWTVTVLLAHERPRTERSWHGFVPILDDFELRALDATEANDFYELVVERHGKSSTIVTSNRDRLSG